MILPLRFIPIFIAVSLTVSCSSDSIKRNTYQSLQTLQQRECQQTPGQDCPQPESYNQYEKQREQDLKQ